MKTGRSPVIFPEGTCSKSGELGSFKPGSLKLNLKAQVPIVPVTINGAYKLLERQGFQIRPAEVSLHISAPLSPQRILQPETRQTGCGKSSKPNYGRAKAGLSPAGLVKALNHWRQPIAGEIHPVFSARSLVHYRCGRRSRNTPLSLSLNTLSQAKTRPFRTI